MADIGSRWQSTEYGWCQPWRDDGAGEQGRQTKAGHYCHHPEHIVQLHRHHVVAAMLLSSSKTKTKEKHFLSMYCLTIDGRETYMVVTRNMFSHQLTMHCKYDLRGSTVAREASDKEKGAEVQIGEEGKKNFLEKLKWDIEFLAQLKIMDCSLLLGIHNVDQAEQEKVEVEE
ncbi:Phosphatidylinositol-5-phosphate 4-kinase type-2 beta [Myotis brandtii]|uniref:Phosphatidylinositol-5-phosphate 4-kinase type-2 beta n=1 Tax=Myotis brandtii TaxID=109478 RepID=S7PH32_MYOBR|nr:Phosphatidylinositol-5-phosphate 4-kinase type-2 beta [Myotis brandtii]